MTDQSGKSYKTVLIGTQTWMAENMAWLPSVSIPGDNSVSVAKYYVYNIAEDDLGLAQSSSSYKTYGVLYNHTAALLACSDPWHLPSDADWDKLAAYGGDLANADSRLKANSDLWIGNAGGSDNFGFAALPGGYYDTLSTNLYKEIGNFGGWWTSSPVPSSNLLMYIRSFDSTVGSLLQRGSTKAFGFSVRCVKD